MTDTRQFLRDKCALAITYAEDGAYGRAAELLQEAANAAKAQYERNNIALARPHWVGRRDGLMYIHPRTNRAVVRQFETGDKWVVKDSNRNTVQAGVSGPSRFATATEAMIFAETINH